MSDRDNQFVAFHEGQVVEVPEEIKAAKPVIQTAPPMDVPYMTRENVVEETEPEVAEEYKRATQKETAPKAPKEPQYVTMKFMIICMIVAIIASTMLGAGISMALGGGNSSSKQHDNLSESNQSAATGSKLTVAEIVEKNADAVVEIVVKSTSVGMWGQTTLQEGAGSGVIVNADGYIVTNYHVIDGANTVTVTLHNGDEYKATIVGGDYAGDLAVRMARSLLLPHWETAVRLLLEILRLLSATLLVSSVELQHRVLSVHSTDS